MENIDNYEYEKKYWNMGFNNIAGVDEVGRGPLIGPVVTACVVLPHNFKLEGLTDSKKLSEKKRNEFCEYIKQNALAYSIGVVGPEEIDEINIYQASKKAMLLAIEDIRKKINVDYILTDAMPLELDIPSLSIVKGDLKSITISAASVIAKVTRDNMIDEMDKEYPMYDLKNNKGYGTKKHLEALQTYGPCKYHRVSYSPVRNALNEKNTKTIENKVNV